MGTPRDYYADLELPATADAADIRKQYRKLALKYHPDRNPGREQEVNTQFQIIQSAHEVLSDPNQKAKYDASRSRSRYPTASGVKGNPWANAGAQYPPPPRRNNAGTRTTPSGAQRWQTRFSTGVPPTAKQYTASDPEAKKNAARAFENMRKGSTAKASEQARPPPPPPPPRTESARQRAEASFGSRKTGFHPRTTMGDEPPVASSNYNSRTSSERYTQAFPQEEPQEAPQEVPQEAPPAGPPPTTMPDPLNQFRDRDSWADPRQSSPYTSHGGEKTNPFDGTPLNRAKSTREAPRHDGPSSDNEAFNRHRSASAPKDSHAEGAPSSSNAPGETSVPRAPEDRPKAPLKKTRSGFKNTSSTAGQQPPDAPTGTPSKSQNNNAGGPSMYEKPSSSTFKHSTLSSTPSPCRIYHENGPVWADIHPFDACPYKSATGSCHTSPSGRQDSPHQLTPFERHQLDFLDKLINNAGIGSSAKKSKHQDSQPDHRASSRANYANSYSFSFPVNDDTFTPTSPDPGRFARSSTDGINTSFVEDEDAAGWRFNAGKADQGSPTKSRPQSGGRAGRRSPKKRPTINRTDTSSIPSESEKPESAFNPQGWSDKFGPQTFVPQPSQSKSVSPTRSTRASSRKPKASKKPSHATLVDDSSSDEEVLEWRGRKGQGEPPVAESPQAMDIDSPPASTSAPPPRPPKVPSPQPARPTPPPQQAAPAPQPMPPSNTTQTSGPAPASNGARNINVEPSRPEWRPGNVEGVNGKEKAAPGPKKDFNLNNVGSEDSEEFRASFADLRNVAPFAQQNAGLKSLADLKDNLPFESKASPEIPMKLPKVHPLVFPTPPVAPRLPPTVAANGVQPNVSSWEKYVKDFENYMHHWDAFNTQVVDHFATRKSQIAKTRAEKGYGFLEARGDAEIQEYYGWLEQDMDVRRRWSAACEEHEHRFREFMAFRMKMK